MASQQSRSNRICYVVYEKRDDKQYEADDQLLGPSSVAREESTDLESLRQAIQAAKPRTPNVFNGGQLRLYEPGAMDYDGKLNPRRMLFDISSINETSYNIFHEDENKRPLIVIAPPSPAQQEVSNDDWCILLSP